MSTIIDKKIAAAKVKSEQSEPPQKVEVIPRKRIREEILQGATYKIKPQSGDAVYITINHDEDGKAFEIFLNSKTMEHFQWVTGLTLTISALFRSQTDLNYLIEELKTVHDPLGGYWGSVGGQKKRFIPSIMAHIGLVLEHHFELLKTLENTHEA